MLRSTHAEAPLRVVEDLHVFRHVRARGGVRGPGYVVGEFDLERREEALGDGVVPAVAAPAHAAHESVRGEDRLVGAAGILGCPGRSDARGRGGADGGGAPSPGHRARAAAFRSCSAQPTTWRENRSRMTTRYNQPSRVQRYVMSDTQPTFGAATVNWRSRMFAATGSPCCESVVCFTNLGARELAHGMTLGTTWRLWRR